MLKKGDKIALVNCSNGQPQSNRPYIEQLIFTLKSLELIPVCSPFLYCTHSIFSGTGRQRADALMEFYTNPEIIAIFDISGGDLANELLEYLDFHVIQSNPKPFFGYSDITTILNAIYTKSNVPCYLYQIRNVISKQSEIQLKHFFHSLFLKQKDLFDITYHFIQGSQMDGIVVGGNIRCFLKLAGTPYFPNLEQKILLLESRSGEIALMKSFLQQLKLMKAFDNVNGILLGTFTQMETSSCIPNIETLVLDTISNENLPIAKTADIGHGSDSKAIIIGKKLRLQQKDVSFF